MQKSYFFDVLIIVLSLLAALIKSKPTGWEVLELLLNLFRAISIITTTSLKLPALMLPLFEFLLFDINDLFIAYCLSDLLIYINFLLRVEWGHLTNLFGHVVNETKLFPVCCFKTSSSKPFIKFASTPKVGTLL